MGRVTDDLDDSGTDLQPVSFGRRISDLAKQRSGEAALIFAAQDGTDHTVTWDELDRTSNRAARRLAEVGADAASTVMIGLPNSVTHIVAAYGAWKLGACVLPLRWDLPEWERERVIDLAAPDAVVADWHSLSGRPQLSGAELDDARVSDEPLPDIVPMPARAIASSGSTGTPKIILSQVPGESVPGQSIHNPTARYLGHRPGQTVLIMAPLYHTNGFLMAHSALFEAQTAVVMEKFDASRAVELIERYRVNTFVAVTIMLQRMARLSGIEDRDLSSIESVLHGGAPLPEWVARTWMELVGPTRFFVCYGSSEQAGTTLTRGDVWLEHPGTVGQVFDSEVKILDENLKPLPPGEIGDIYMRWVGQTSPSFDYRGATPATLPDFFSTVGDLGWLDEDGFLFLADRRKDLIISGGANVFAAEVEMALSAHPNVRDVVVVGITDDEWGQRVHAVVEALPDSTLTAEQLSIHCRERLASYKVPRTFEFVEKLARSDAGKIRRSDYARSPIRPD